MREFVVSMLVGAPLLLGVHFVAEGTDFGRALKNSAGAAVADGRVLALALRDALSGRVVAAAFEVADEPVGAVSARVEAAAASAAAGGGIGATAAPSPAGSAAGAADNIGEVFEDAQRVSPEIHAITGAKRPGRKPVFAMRAAARTDLAGTAGAGETWRERRIRERNERIAARRAETEARHPRGGVGTPATAAQSEACRQAVLASYVANQLAFNALVKFGMGQAMTSAESQLLSDAFVKEAERDRLCGGEPTKSERKRILLGFEPGLRALGFDVDWLHE